MEEQTVTEESSSLFQRFLRSYHENDVIFEEGSRGNEMYIIYRGKVRILKKTGTGEVRTLAVEEPGDFFGEMALVDGSPRSASAIAAEDGTELIVLDNVKFSYMVKQVPEFALAIMRRLARSLRESDLRVEAR